MSFHTKLETDECLPIEREFQTPAEAFGYAMGSLVCWFKDEISASFKLEIIVDSLSPADSKSSGITITSIDGQPLGQHLLPLSMSLIEEIAQNYCPNCEQKRSDCTCKERSA